MFNYKFVSYVALILLTQHAWSERVGRIDTDHVNERCSKRPISEETCRKKRGKAIQIGCVTQAEADLLQRHNLCPICNWDKNGIDAYWGFCPQGCFARGTKILVRDLADGQTKWEAVEVVATRFKELEIFSVDAKSPMDKPSFSSRPVLMASTGPEDDAMVNVVTQRGDRLNVTSNHAVMLLKGGFILAGDLTTSDSIATYDGCGAKIASIDRIHTSELVYNFLLDVESPISHSIVSEGGLITGDQYWQDELEQ